MIKKYIEVGHRKGRWFIVQFEYDHEQDKIVPNTAKLLKNNMNCYNDCSSWLVQNQLKIKMSLAPNKLKSAGSTKFRHFIIE